MKYLLISCSGVKDAGSKSNSYRICKNIENKILKKESSSEVETIKLFDYTMSNCIFCGKCFDSGQCPFDNSFNSIFNKMMQSDIVIFSVPFYSVIPSKLVMIFEKINQIYYTAYLKNPEEKFILTGKKAGVVVHGGSNFTENPNAKKSYEELLLKPISFSLEALGFDIEKEDGVMIDSVGFDDIEGAIFPDTLYDFKKYNGEIDGLLNKLLM